MADSQRVDVLRNLVAKYLDEIGLQYLKDQNNNFLVPFGEGVRLHLVPKELGDDMTVIQIIAPTNVGLNVTGELAMFIATENAKFIFGRLALYPNEHAVGFEESLLGDFLNRAELEVAIGVAASMANKYDDEIMQRFGGQKAGPGI
ncbi:MAG: hypothetical protein QMC79_03145 [Anaerosomatales bacterium]|nr:hypothetical protein [Anaerosomatales bacterium]